METLATQAKLGWSYCAIFNPAVSVFTPLACSLLRVAIAAISGREKSSRYKNTSFCQTLIFPASRANNYLKMEIETLCSNFCNWYLLQGPVQSSSFQVVRGKPQISKQEVVDDKGSLAELCSCSNKVCGDSALIYVCAFFLLPFS